MLTVDGLHVPGMPLTEVLGNVGTVPPAQITSEVPNAKVGVILGLTTTFLVTGIPHCPGVGVNVYDPEAILLMTAGFHVPVNPLLDVAGKVGGVVPAQNAGIGANVGVYTGFERMTPVFNCVGQPLAVTSKSE